MTTGRDADAVAALQRIDRAVADERGHEAFPERLWSTLRDQPDACLISVTVDAGAALVPSDTFAPAHRQMVAAAPSAGSGRALTTAVRALLDADAGTEQVVAWIPGSDPRVVASLERAGFVVGRSQIQMEVALPLRSEPAFFPPDVALRTFRPGIDETAWLTVNNAAFANHAEQGGWIESVLARRMAEPWFDPDGFLLAWRGSKLVGFCWTKVHPRPVPCGEIFVIGVDPSAQGLGLGRALVVAGLDDLHRRRDMRRAILYVAADNDAAIALYTSLGFVPRRTDTALHFDRNRP